MIRPIRSAMSIATTFAITIASTCAQAADTTKWVMSFPSPSGNSTEFEQRYGGVDFLNRDAGGCASCSSQILSTNDSTGSYARWQFANPAAIRVDYDDVGGFLLPLDPHWSWNHDLRNAAGIRIKVRSSAQTDFRLGLEGPAAPFSSAGVQPEIGFTAGPKWKWIWLELGGFSENPDVTLRLSDKSINVTVADSMGRNRTVKAIFNNRKSWASNDPSDLNRFDDDSGNVLKHVRALKFIPKIAYLVTKLKLDIDSIVIVGVEPQWGRIRGSGACQGQAIVVDQFDESRPSTTKNLLGGAWETVLDSSALKPNGLATGNSSVAPLPYGAWAPLYGAMMEARLDRVDPMIHPNGGWTRLTTWLNPDKSPRSIPDLKAISFRAQAGRLDTLFDTTKIHGVTLRLHSSTVDDSVAYFVRVPFDKIRPVAGDSGRTVCIDLDELRQAGWYTGKAGIRTIEPFSLTAISWTLSLDEAAATSANPSRISLWDAKLWTDGISGPTGIPSAPRSLQARAIEGHLVVSAERGRNLHVQIRDLSGRVVLDRSLWASGSEQRVALPRRSDLLLASVTDGSTRTHLRIIPR
ncbi:MAG: hypothetical protein IPO40_03965 [Fibrobacteres bacterium]|nr:hypothetical protein [Fibrobacterota bacterium]